MSIDALCETHDISDFERYDSRTIMWYGRNVCQEDHWNTSVVLASIIQDNAHVYGQHKIKSLGEGSYEVEVTKDSDGTASASGSVSYETDGGVKVEVEVKVDSEGTSSASVSVGGKF